MPSKSAKLRRAEPREKLPARRIAIVAFPGVTLLDISGPAQVFAELQEIELPCVVEHKPRSVRGSIGIACCPEHGKSADLLLQRAVHTRRGESLATAGIALCFALLIASAWNAGAMVPPPTSAGAAALLLALVESTATWRHRDRADARDRVLPPINEPSPRALPYYGAANQGRFLPTP